LFVAVTNPYRHDPPDCPVWIAIPKGHLCTCVFCGRWILPPASAHAQLTPNALSVWPCRSICSQFGIAPAGPPLASTINIRGDCPTSYVSWAMSESLINEPAPAPGLTVKVTGVEGEFTILCGLCFSVSKNDPEDRLCVPVGAVIHLLLLPLCTEMISSCAENAPLKNVS